MSDVQNRVPLPDVDPAKVAYIHSLMRQQGLPIPRATSWDCSKPATPESPEEKIGRLFTERGYSKGLTESEFVLVAIRYRSPGTDRP